jgi:hypothetical protein
LEEDIDGFSEAEPKTREQLVDEATRAQQAMLSSGFGSGENAVFSSVSQQGKEATREQKRNSFVDRLAAAIASKIGEQLAALPSVIAEANKQPQSTQQQEPVKQEQQGVFGIKPVTPFGFASARSATPEIRQEPARELPTTSLKPSAPDVRPASLKDVPLSSLPDRPMGLDPVIPMRSLDDEPKQQESGELPPRGIFSNASQQGDIGGPKQAAAMRLGQFDLPPQAASDAMGYPTFQATGTQVSELTELGRELADSNQEFHTALTMFIRQMVSAHQHTIEELYQAQTILERMEGPI